MRKAMYNPNKLDYRENEKLALQRTRTAIQKTVIYTFLIFMAILFLVPFYWMFNISFQSNDEVLISTNLSYFPKVFSPSNYLSVIKYKSSVNNISFPRYLGNTLFVAGASTLFGTLFSILVAFALARLNFKGKELIFTILLATMMIPGEMMVISNYVTVSKLGWADHKGMGSYLSMIVPFLVSIFHIYLLRQNFKQIPNELYYAAKVDNCSDRKYLWRVMVPMAKSSIITITILKLMGAWNAFVWPDLVAHNEYKLVTTWLRSSFVPDEGIQRVLINYQMAAAVVVTVPLLLMFVFFRKYIMSGVSRSGVKG